MMLQIEKCKGHIIEAVRYCDEAEGDQPISEDAYDDAGELDASAIFCAKCRAFESYDVRTRQARTMSLQLQHPLA